MLTIVNPGFEIMTSMSDTHNIVKLIEKAGRTCYKSEDKITDFSAEQFVKMIVKSGHHSVLEHERLIFEFIHPHLDKLEVITLLSEVTGFEISHEHDTVIVSANLRTIRDMTECARTILAMCILKKAYEVCPIAFEDLVIDQGLNIHFNTIKNIKVNVLTKHQVFEKLSLREAEKHINVTVKIIGDRSMSHQLVRHRLAAYSQESQRYCDYGKSSEDKGLIIVCPKTIAKGDCVLGSWDVYERLDNLGKEILDSNHEFASWLYNIQNAYMCYFKLRKDGVPSEDARSVLPNATKTEVVTTFNIRQWRHVFTDRALNPKAQWQIRGIMQGILREFAKLMPEFFGDQLDLLNNMKPEKIEEL